MCRHGVKPEIRRGCERQIHIAQLERSDAQGPTRQKKNSGRSSVRVWVRSETRMMRRCVCPARLKLNECGVSGERAGTVLFLFCYVGDRVSVRSEGGMKRREGASATAEFSLPE